MPKRIDISPIDYKFDYQREGEYIHKYYIPRALQKEVTRQDVAGLCSFYYSEASGEKLSSNIRSIVSKGAVLFYTDLCCEKFLCAAHVAAILAAVKTYTKERRARPSDEDICSAMRINKRLARLETRIKKGGMAIEAWFKMQESNNPEEIEGTRRALLVYCKLDTLAMVKLLDKLREISA